jgi:membrane fusion protein, multidrug efflux system
MRDNIKVVSDNPAPAPDKKSRKKTVRRILLILGPLVVLIGGGAMYLLGGRYISTDNAYTKADIVSVAPEISGPIAGVSITDNQPVKKGDVLFTIDSKPFDIALNLAKANLAAARLDINSLRAQYAQSAADVRAAAADRDYAQKNYDRERALQRKNSAAISPTEMDKVVHDLDAAGQRFAALQQQQAQILASLDGDPDMPIENHAKIKAAQAAVDQAQLNIARTIIRAALDGVSGAAPHAGDYAHAQVPSMSIVASASLRIEANYKETDLTRMHPGQPATIAIDTYPGHTWSGTVQSISPASESEFSILPAQNATGNWVKVVQRIPVRVTITHQPGEPGLRSGMSAEVTVDTGSYPNLP